MVTCYLSLGTNLGDRRQNLSNAHKLLVERVGEIIGESRVYETEPWGYADSQNYFNEVLGITTRLTATELLKTCMHIEAELGRTRSTEGYTARTMDIDILFYGTTIINSTKLIVPHEHMHKRLFVLKPLVEIAPDFVHPVLNATITQLLKQCKDDSFIQKVR